jgi:5-methylcytosine-specific restriction endonuclease McrA
MKWKIHTRLYEFQQKAHNGGGSCEKCGRKTDYLTVDHIVPLSFIDALGLKELSYNHDWNFQLLCRACNKLKGTVFDFTNPRTLPNLKRYVAEVENFYKL